MHTLTLKQKQVELILTYFPTLNIIISTYNRVLGYAMLPLSAGAKLLKYGVHFTGTTHLI